MGICLVVVSVFLLPSFLSAQILPLDENEAIQIKGIAAANNPEGFRWSLWYETRVDDIQKLTLYDLSSGQEKEILSVKGKEIYEPGFKSSEVLELSQLGWIYEEGLTVRMFRLDIERKDSSTSLYLPRTFDESIKGTHRLLFKQRQDHEQPLKRVRPYFYLDSRRWTLDNALSRETYTIYRYKLEDPPEGPDEIVLQAFLQGDHDPGEILGENIKQMKKDCRNPRSSTTRLTTNAIFFEWKHEGCEDRGPLHLIGIFQLKPEEGYVQDIRYVYKAASMPDQNYSVWKAILMRMVGALKE